MTRTLAIAALMSTTAMATAQEIRIGLQEDPDILDPDQSRTFVGRIVYASLCDKLVDIDPELNIVPQLATEWSFSEDGTALTMQLREDASFHDGTPFDAEAVAANLERSTSLPESRRTSELASISGWEVLGPHEIRIDLEQPDATLLAQFADRSGMMLSPAATEEMGAEFGAEPICSGPFRFVERVQQDRIVLERFEEYWNADAIAFERVVFLPIPDSTVRLANLRAGDLDMLERLAATDAGSVEADDGLVMERATSLGYDGITINVGNGDRAEGPLGSDPLVRRALSHAIDRQALVQVVFDGAFTPGNQSFPPDSPWFNTDLPVPERDVEEARRLLEEAGHGDGVSFELQHSNSPDAVQTAQVVQAMAGEAGFDVSLVSKEFASMLQDQTAGAYDATLVGWSGRVDPDGNIHQFMTCEGGINDSGFCGEEVDRLLNEARTTTDTEARKEAYDAARAILSEQMPIVYLWHDTWLWALDASVEGFTPYPDGMIRLEGVSLSE
jgi:peptide/nickel transport system substrate-binding protein